MSSPRRAPAIGALALAFLCAGGCTRRSKATKDVVAVQAETMRAYRDPVTGRLTVPPAVPAAAQPQATQAVQSSTSGLVETPSPYGGVVVHLQGRFTSQVVATRTHDGGLRTRCDEPRVGAAP